MNDRGKNAAIGLTALSLTVPSLPTGKTLGVSQGEVPAFIRIYSRA
jgi:hypothetical protein